MKLRLIIFTAVLAFLLSACQLSLAEDITPPPNYQSPTPGPTMSPLFPQTSPNLASGAAIFAEKCAPCHGAKGLGDGPMAAQLQKPPAPIGKPEIGRAGAMANWYSTVTQGNINSFMPPFNSSLSDQQRWDVVAYALSLGGSTPAEAEKGKDIYTTSCVQCHGPSGDLVANSNFTDQALMAKLSQTDIANFINKGVGNMKGFGGLLQDEDIYAVSAYVRTFTVIAGEAAAAPSATPQAPEATSTVAAAVTPDTSTTPEATPAPGSTAETTPAATSQATPAVSETPAASATPTEVTGTLSGKVSNGSGGSLPADLKATLHIYEHNTTAQQFSEVSTQVAPVSADGGYKFENIPMPSNRAFFVSVEYAATEYQSDPIFPKAGQTDYDLPVVVYETTTDASTLVADQVHILLDYSKAGVVQVVEFMVITNTGTKSVVPAEKGGPVVVVNLPKGYSNLQFDQGAIGGRYLKSENGFADTTSVTPGMKNYQLVFAVDLPLPKAGIFGGQKFDFTQQLPLKVNGLSVLVPTGVSIEGSNFTAGKEQDMGNGTKYMTYTYSATNLDAGQNIQVTASGMPKGTAAATTGTSGSQNIIIGVGAFGLVLILAGVWLYLRERNRPEDNEEFDEGDEEDEENPGGSDEIMDAIMALDDQFKAGKIQEAAYRERREELKNKLKGTL